MSPVISDPPERVYLPAHRVPPDAGEVELELRRLEDGQPALPAFSSLSRLVSGCGGAQPWVLVPTEQLTAVREATGADLLLLVARRAPSLTSVGEQQKLPAVGWALTAEPTRRDIADGKPADQAITSAVVSTGAGAGATAALLAMAPAAIAGGPVTLAAVGVGIAVSMGVGWFVDNHYDDMKDAVGDAAGASRTGSADERRSRLR